MSIVYRIYHNGINALTPGRLKGPFAKAWNVRKRETMEDGRRAEIQETTARGVKDAVK